MQSAKSRQIDYFIPECPLCGESHNYVLEIGPDELVAEIITFGGKKDPKADEQSMRPPNSVKFLCPEQNMSFRQEVSLDLAPGEKVVRAILKGTETAPTISEPISDDQDLDVQSVLSGELLEWVRSGTTTARDYCKNMLSICIGAIPVYFATLKFLGVDHPSSTLPGWLSVIAPILFLLAGVLFIVALRPQYMALSSLREFASARASRLKRLNMFITVGTVLFLVGVLVAIGTFVWALTI